MPHSGNAIGGQSSVVLGEGTGKRLVEGRELAEMRRVAKAVDHLDEHATTDPHSIAKHKVLLKYWSNRSLRWQDDGPHNTDTFGSPEASLTLDNAALWLEAVLTNMYIHSRNEVDNDTSIPTQEANPAMYMAAAVAHSTRWFADMYATFNLTGVYAWSPIFPRANIEAPLFLEGDAGRFRALIGDILYAHLLVPAVIDLMYSADGSGSVQSIDWSAASDGFRDRAEEGLEHVDRDWMYT